MRPATPGPGYRCRSSAPSSDPAPVRARGGRPDVGGAAAQSFGTTSLPPLPAAAPVQLTLSLRPRHPRCSSGWRSLPAAGPAAAAAGACSCSCPPRDMRGCRRVMAAPGLRLPLPPWPLDRRSAAPGGRRTGLRRVACGGRARGRLRLRRALRAPAGAGRRSLGWCRTWRVWTHDAAAAAGSPGGRVRRPLCPARAAAQTGGYLPAQLGSAGGYGQSALIAGGYDGSRRERGGGRILRVQAVRRGRLPGPLRHSRPGQRPSGGPRHR